MAMRNCAIAYQAIGNVEAELEMRKLLVQVLKNELILKSSHSCAFLH